MIGIFKRKPAGRSAERRHQELRRAWQTRIFGQRARLYATTAFSLLIVFIVGLHLSGRWSFLAGLILGMAIMGTWLLPDALLPSHIRNWQLGAWGRADDGG